MVRDFIRKVNGVNQVKIINLGGKALYEGEVIEALASGYSDYTVIMFRVQRTTLTLVISETEDDLFGGDGDDV